MSDDSDRFSFIYGDDYGEIDVEKLGQHNGAVTRQMDMPDRLAHDLYEDLDEYFQEATDKYVVYGTDGFNIANVVIVKARSEKEAIEKAKDDVEYIGSNPHAKEVESTPEHGEVWAAVR